MAARDEAARATIELTASVALSAAERAAIVALCEAAFAEDFSQLFIHFARSWHVQARLDGAPISHACWVERWLQPAGAPVLRTAYIEAVATLPERQGQGYGKMVMERIAREIAPYELGALSPARPGFYERLGWEHWRGPTAIRTDAGLLPTPEEEIMILRTPQTPPLDLDAAITAEWREGELW